MNYLKKTITTIGSIFLAALLIAAIAPKATHGLVAALVQVTNTTASPAITADADKSSRQPYLSTRIANPSVTGQDIDSFSGFTAVPTGYRLRIENVSFKVTAESGNPVPWAQICSNGAPDDCFPSFPATYTGSASAGQTAVADQNVVRYIDPGDSPILKIHYDAQPGEARLSIAGYLENCAVTGCPAVLH